MNFVRFLTQSLQALFQRSEYIPAGDTGQTNIMTSVKLFTPREVLSREERAKLTTFLFEHLDEYGDPATAIEKAIVYANSTQTPGGYLIEIVDGDQILSAAVVNKTGMAEYIPENIVVYLATHKEKRGQGLGKQLMQQIVDMVEGDIALHVEPRNPAKNLYERVGFVNKYLEMRLIKK